MQTLCLCIIIVKNFVTTPKTQKLDSFNKCATLLVLYLWERAQDLSSQWVQILVPSHTCLLYVSYPGKYRCIVEEEMFTFTVMHRGK